MRYRHFILINEIGILDLLKSNIPFVSYYTEKKLKTGQGIK